jgi:single-stranded-DNA-specific exonuclease
VLALAPFGAGNPYPLFFVSGAEVSGPPTIIKEKHLRVRLRSNGRSLFVKAWNFADRAGQLAPGTRVDAVVSFEEDPFSAARGYPPWSAQLRDFRPAGGENPSTEPQP